MTVAKIIHANVFDPTRSLFKVPASTKAECQTISCSNLDCPLLARGQCWKRGGLFGNTCPYGTARFEKGPTKKAAGFSRWIGEKRKELKDVPFLDAPPDRMEFIGDFVLLPYAHMAMCNAVAFTKHSSFISSGEPFLPRQEWTLSTVLTLLNFKPQALFGGEITKYQKEVIPKFLLHLREVDLDMWSQLVAVRPELDAKPNHVGRKALLRTLRHPIEWTESAHNYPVTWVWNGKTLTTTSMNSYSSTWGNIKIKSVVIEATPDDNATVVVRENDWVLSDTLFAD